MKIPVKNIGNQQPVQIPIRVIKINSILQFLTLNNGNKITLVTNPNQPVTSKRNRGATYPVSMWLAGQCWAKTSKMIEETAKKYPFIMNTLYV